MNRHCSTSYSVLKWIIANRWMLLKLNGIVKGELLSNKLERAFICYTAQNKVVALTT